MLFTFCELFSNVNGNEIVRYMCIGFRLLLCSLQRKPEPGPLFLKAMSALNVRFKSGDYDSTPYRSNVHILMQVNAINNQTPKDLTGHRHS